MAERAPGRFDGAALMALFAAIYVATSPCALHDESLAVLGLPGAPAAAASTWAAATLRALVDFGGICGLTPHRAACTVVAIAGAVAVRATHGAARSAGASRGHANYAALLAGTCPALAVAATTIHTHALTAMVAALALWFAVLVARSGAWGFAVPLGVCCGLAHAGSPAGALVPLVALPWIALERADVGGNPRRCAQLAGAALVVSIGLAALLLRGRLASGMPTLEQVRAYDLGTLAPLVVRDAGRSYLPLSLAVFVAAWTRACHREALLLLGAAVPGVLLGCHLTATLGDDGSFLLPLLPAAALVAVRASSPRLLFALVAAAAVLAGAKIALRADWGAAVRFAAGVRAVAAGRPCSLVTGAHRDEAFVLARLPDVQQERVLPVAAPAPARTPEQFVEALRAACASGRCLVITDEAEQDLRDPVYRAGQPGAAALLRQLEAAFAWRQVVSEGFAGHELVPR